MNKKLGIVVGLILFAIVIAPASAPPKFSLMSTLHSRSIPLEVRDLVLVTPTRAFVWNFTVDLTGKDGGSDRFDFVLDVVSTTLVALMSDSNLTAWLSSPLNVSSTQRLSYSAIGSPVAFGSSTSATGDGISMSFLPPASGSYHVVILNPLALIVLVPGVPTPMHVEIHGLETWTTTIIV